MTGALSHSVMTTRDLVAPLAALKPRIGETQRAVKHL
jgi:hypothetical protein